MGREGREWDGEDGRGRGRQGRGKGRQGRGGKGTERTGGGGEGKEHFIPPRPQCSLAVGATAGRPNLRSANCGQLDVPRVTLSSCGVRAFAHAGPSLWNTLPVHLKNRNLTLTTFMRHLKSYLFSQY